MNYTRRQALAIGAIGITGISGCSSAVEFAGEGPIERTASQAKLSEDIDVPIMDFGEKTIERTISVPNGEDRKIIANNQYIVYGDLFYIATTPGFTVAGQNLNPIASIDNKSLVEEVNKRYDILDDLNEVSKGSIKMLGTETTASEFDAVHKTKNAYDEEIRRDIHFVIASVNNKNDVVIAGAAALDSTIRGEADIIDVSEDIYEHIIHPAKINQSGSPEEGDTENDDSVRKDYGPVTIVKHFLATVDEGNKKEVKKIVHPESPVNNAFEKFSIMSEKFSIMSEKLSAVSSSAVKDGKLEDLPNYLHTDEDRLGYEDHEFLSILRDATNTLINEYNLSDYELVALLLPDDEVDALLLVKDNSKWFIWDDYESVINRHEDSANDG